MSMQLKDVVIHTNVIAAGMTVKDIFDECIRVQVQALPFCDSAGAIKGRVTLKNIMKVSCLPEYMVELAPVLGAQLSCVQDAEAKVQEVLNNPVEPYIQSPHVSISSESPTIKALAIMEKNDTSYVFIVDDGTYRGIVTIQGIARTMASLESPVSVPA
ncbi:MAG: CBS domain-containing protein [Pseudomonadota bacterium]|nr:CBS domain-containing protein [Pseudomonadota bacterium]